ncbi:nicotinate-nucleotide--dimethylbenzimidazole phosphoribosyltransferase [Xanthomonas prunicola]|uniref:Nicotinate-nucleotide--dimethylbenzimidazole phosphoribosyltransferase n=1 Tax=Xanthomonas prunicola TaxID=2053930 RepID=A0A2N3RNJ4_9XANT|nr:nicotinate-nucleotide--dimethylbenzimidazole phosphoribosyltransferase [Xanthomonas prunicola]PKV14062.1 nicotinate-nucleotide--dimethylbenzimidazole phosphoribosyltransferase [Xanthomonas prunicola]PKV18343.1 nicotinate-nucleotide--dimethylbenzimidazole phosphoribosyltransferase [Xanthomonas prunicola]PKV22346.1 nicotinate-nucleotide--dimethylbenzimidazole phosphoribosyltransferase [Xanthomonas prunicola]
MSSDWIFGACAVPDARMRSAALARQEQLTKPPGALGRLEHLAVQLAAWQRTEHPGMQRVWIAVYAADHGVAAEGVSAFPQAVTGEMVRNFARGGAAIAVLARELGARLEVVNLGVVNDPGELPRVRRAWIAPSTANICEQPAMTATQLRDALAAGADSIAQAKSCDTQLFVGGEMGIGNTTSAATLGCALLSQLPQALAGAGTGLDAEGIAHKTTVITRSLALHADASTPLERLRRLGGFEIAALVGAYIAAAQAGIPVLVDGFITTAAALVATRLNPGVREWLLFGHRSQERGHAALLRALDAEPLLQLDLRLGEASGAAVAIPLLRSACALHNGMATFAEAGVSDA